MHTDQQSIQTRLRNFFVEQFIYKNVNKKDMQKQVATYLKELLRAEFVAIYQFNDWNGTYELVTNFPVNNHHFRTFMNYLHDEEILHKNVKEITVVQEFQTENWSYVLPIIDGDRPLGFVVIVLAQEVKDFDSIQVIADETNKLFTGYSHFTTMIEQANRYERLYRVTTKFHSSIDTHDVLSEVIHTLTDVYPQFNHYLLLAQDYHNEKDLPIKQLIYNHSSTKDSSVQAFLTGNIQVDEDKLHTTLYAPLKGKQGIYGVLQIIAPHAHIFPDNEVEFITLLANTAGNALENAKLYQQSKQLITDLQLINQTSHTLNSNLKLTEITTYMHKQIKESFQAEEVGFILFKDDKRIVLEGSTKYFFMKDSQAFLDYVLPKLVDTRESLFVSDLPKKLSTLDLKYHSIMAIPMVQSNQVKGAIIVLSQDPAFFSFEAFKLIQSIVHHSTLAFVNSMLKEQLEQLVITDYLTNLYSRKYLDERVLNHRKADDKGAFLLIDIDNFKMVNDMYGHDKGDQLLIQVANIIKINLDKNDIPCRWGGEELAIYLPDATLETGVQLANELVRQVRTYTKPRITISVGVAHWDKELPENETPIFDRADQALYKAKTSGKNRVVSEKDIMNN